MIVFHILVSSFLKCIGNSTGFYQTKPNIINNMFENRADLTK